MDLVTAQMDGALQRLQRVKAFDFAAAYHAAYEGISALDPRKSKAACELIYGRTLAYQVWKRRNVLSTSW